MSSVSSFDWQNHQIKYESTLRTTIKTCFYQNNVTVISDLETAYHKAYALPQTIVTDLAVKKPEKFGLPADAKVLVANDGEIVGRTASARRLILTKTLENKFSPYLREVIYQGATQNFLTCSVIVGLHNDFTVKAHLMLPENFSMNLYNYLLNFQIATEALDFYSSSQAFEEGDIFIYADPNWQDPDYPEGLSLIDPVHNCAAILGLRYFGELKKATLTLAWQIAHRNGFIACHGGLKQYQLPQKKFTIACFGLSGSGKSTLTLADHNQRFPITVLHDDAFVINQKTGATTALEPSYFDKTQDYPMGHQQIEYLLTAQNVGVAIDKAGKKVLVNEDIRNGNGRCIKSRLATKNRANHLAEKLDAVFWIMKDDSLPPLVKVEEPELAAIYGATLATKRSSAENVAQTDELVIEPFANPFRSYPLQEDFEKFQQLFASGVSCYILNTGFFQNKKVTPQITLQALEDLLTDNLVWQPLGPLSQLSYAEIPEMNPDFNNSDYLALLKAGLDKRLCYLTNNQSDPFNQLPISASDRLVALLKNLKAV